MMTFVALFRGRNVDEAKLVQVSIDPVLVAQVTRHMRHECRGKSEDPAIARLDCGRRAALRFIQQEASHAEE